MGALLAEVKGLRADLNQAAGTSIRMQLLVARLALQEQRTTVVARQLADVQAELATAIRERFELQTRIERFERATISDLPADQQRDIERSIEYDRTTILPARVQREQQLRAREAELQTMLSNEQGRWIEFNSRLDELERSLPAAGAPR